MAERVRRAAGGRRGRLLTFSLLLIPSTVKHFSQCVLAPLKTSSVSLTPDQAFALAMKLKLDRFPKEDAGCRPRTHSRAKSR